MATKEPDWAAWAGSAARTTGCALAPPPGVEEFKEVIVLCGMSSGMQDVCHFFFFFPFFILSSESYHMLKATGFEDNATPLDACVARCWHTDVCGHPPPHSPTTAWRIHRQEQNPPSAVIRLGYAGVQSSNRGGWKTCHLKKQIEICTL